MRKKVLTFDLKRLDLLITDIMNLSLDTNETPYYQ